jgi:enoyl-CoA hydratase
MSSAADIVTSETRGHVAIITMDDGKANALAPAMLSALDAAFEAAKNDAGVSAVVLAGRNGKFCAGFDLKIMMSGPDAARQMVKDGGEFLMRVYEFPKPLVVACTGHALAGGVLLVATGDTRIGTQGPFKLGLNEVKAGIPIPILAHAMAADRLDRRAFVEAVLQARIYDPDSAVVAGWLDRVSAPESLLADAIAEAERLAELPATAYAKSKHSIRRATIQHIRDTIAGDLAELMGG